MSSASSAHSPEGPVVAPPAHPAATFAAIAALRRSVAALTRARERRPVDVDGADDWLLDGPLSETAESRERLAHTGERQAWVARDSAESAFAAAVTAYTRLLRGEGMRPHQALRAVAAVAREAAAPSIDGDRLDAAIHDAGRHCVEAYFAR
jgi:hypothetical protein